MVPEPTIERLLPALVHAQTHLEDDLSLDALAGKAFLSPHHFHRTFKRVLGETTRQYVERIRLERAAFLLGLQTDSILGVGIDVGYPRPETFSRAFKRHFGQTPRQYRAMWQTRLRTAPPGTRKGLEEHGEASLGATRIRRVGAMHVAFIRHVGPYEAVPPSLFNELITWGRDEPQPLLLGLGHDSPAITPVDKLRFDACLRVSKPFRADGRIGCQEIPGGILATTQHVGPYSTLTAAWGEVFGRVMALKGYRTPGLPVLEIYDATELNPDYRLNQTELCMWLESTTGD